MEAVRKWTEEESTLELLACFDSTERSILNSLTLSHIMSALVRMCAQTKTFSKYKSDKPWYPPSQRKLRQSKEYTYISEDRALYKQARNRVSKEIKIA